MSRLGPLLSPILIGRDDLLDEAERRIASAAHGRGQFLLIAGEAGIGKTRLIAAIERKAQAAGFRSAPGLLAPQDRNVPGASLLDLARTMTRIPAFADVGRQLLGLADATFEASQPRRRALVLRAVDLIRTAVDGPLMLWFDDLQWADDLSLEIVTELARATRNRPVLLVGAYRTDELVPTSILRPWRSRLLSQRMAEEARLDPLTLEQTALMTTVILATGLPAPRAVAEAVYERTDGVPLHVEELLGALDEEQRTDSRAIRDANVPETLGDAIVQRIGRLSPDAQEVARCGAVIGRCFVPEVLAGVMDRPSEALEGPLRELVEHDVLEPPGARGLYDFRHQLLRDTLYGTLGQAQLRRLHARAAEYGMELEGASEVHASLHFERAGMRPQAFRSALAGARAAARISSHRQAFDLYVRAARHIPDDLPLAKQAAILEALAVEAAAVEEIQACERAAEDARGRFARAGDSVGAARQLVNLAGMARRETRPLESRLEMIEAAIAEVDRLPASAEAHFVRGRLGMELVRAAVEALQLGRAREALAAGVLDAREARDDETVLEARSLAGLIETLEGPGTDGLAEIGAAARRARELGFEDTGVTAYRDAAIAAAQVMDYRRAAAWIDEGLRYADAIQQSHCAHIMVATRGLIAWAEGRWDEAVALGADAVAGPGCARGRGLGRWSLVYVALGRGDLPEARRHLAAARSFAERSGTPDALLATSWGSAEVAVVAGEYQVAIDESEAAVELAGRSGERARFVPFVVTGTRARILGGRPADARRWLDRASAILERCDAFAPPALEHARGLVALAEGSFGVARGSFERAAAGWESRGRRWEALWARLDLAGCLARAGRANEATLLVADVREAALRLGSRPLLERADAIGRRARGRAAEVEPWHPLTDRELEVARLVATGSTNAEIASELGIAAKTASAHVEHILAKLGATRRAEIATWVATIPAAAAPEPAGARVTGRGEEWRTRPDSNRRSPA